MGKNKKSKITFENLELDSKEELLFIHWLNEAKENNLISEYKYQPEEYVLSDKVTLVKQIEKKKKLVDKEVTILNKHIYTPDFCVKPTEKFYELYYKFGWDKIFKRIEINDGYLIIDIKGSFNQAGGDRVFSINQKWIYQKYGIYITKIVPDDLFELTWCPELCRLTPVKKQPIEKYKDFKKLSSILK